MEYYLRNVHAGYLGNAPIWWAIDGKGYTAYLEKAHRFSKEDAESFQREDKHKWEIYPCDFIDHNAHKVFDAQDFRQLEQWRKP